MFLIVIIYFMTFKDFLVSFCDAPEVYQLGLQDSATPAHEGMTFFHNYLLVFMIVIGFGVCYLLGYIILSFSMLPQSVNTILENAGFKKEEPSLKFSHSSPLEIVWTLIPAIILVFIAIPSFNLLYSLDELIEPEVTLKIIGHQWYWTYEYSDSMNWEFNSEDSSNSTTHIELASIKYDSYMVNTEDLTYGAFRLLEVDNRVVLPIKTHIRLLVTAADVLHCWTIPSFGIKMDACPGRLTQVSLFIKRAGTFYGQCSEICGIRHGFMPIVVEAVEPAAYNIWLETRLLDCEVTNFSSYQR